MGFFGKLLSSALPVIGKFFGGNKQQASPQTEGIQSQLGAAGPPPMAQGSDDESAFAGIKSQLLNRVIGSGLNALFGRFDSRVRGAANRAYLNASFPELTPWEQAGAHATGMDSAGIGSQIDAQTREQRFQEKQQKRQIAFGDRQLETQERIANIHGAASVQAAGISASPMLAQVDGLNALRSEQALTEVFRQAGIERDTQNKAMDSSRYVIADFLNGHIPETTARNRLAGILLENAGKGLSAGLAYRLGGKALTRLISGGSKVPTAVTPTPKISVPKVHYQSGPKGRPSNRGGVPKVHYQGAPKTDGVGSLIE